jgi:hypothetical protein
MINAKNVLYIYNLQNYIKIYKQYKNTSFGLWKRSVHSRYLRADSRVWSEFI